VDGATSALFRAGGYRVRDRKLVLRDVGSDDATAYKRWLTDARLLDWHGGPDTDREFDRVLRSKYNFVVEVAGVPIGYVAVRATGLSGLQLRSES
jgi:hypothetical protein